MTLLHCPSAVALATVLPVGCDAALPTLLPVGCDTALPDETARAPVASPPEAMLSVGSAPLRPTPSVSTPGPPPNHQDESLDGRICDLPDTPYEALLFATGDYEPCERGMQILDDVVACTRGGFYGDETLVVVGYADPRGAIDS